MLLPATRVGEISNAKILLAQVEEVIATGSSNLESGLAAGYNEVQSGYRSEQVNRVVFISDGLGNSDKAIDIVQQFRKRGISISTITVGMNCDLNTMNRLSKYGAGSSRFISNREKMEELFGSGLDRMVVPIAYDLTIELQLAQGVELLETWGYDHQVDGNTIRYSLPALHHRDYETMLARLRLPVKGIAGKESIAVVKVSFTDRAGSAQSRIHKLFDRSRWYRRPDRTESGYHAAHVSGVRSHRPAVLLQPADLPAAV